jgi:DNA replication protein DnaC
VELIEQATRFCADYFRNPSPGRSLVLIGNNGIGKTHTARAIATWARHVANDMRHPVVIDGQVSDLAPAIAYHHWPTFLDSLKSGGWHLVEECERAGLLVIDELGGGYDPNRVGADKLCRILSKREFKWNLITSNLQPEEWEAALDRRIASRLNRNSTLLIMDEVEDYNLPKE